MKPARGALAAYVALYVVVELGKGVVLERADGEEDGDFEPSFRWTSSYAVVRWHESFVRIQDLE